jgi:hypothetical protein
MYIEPMKHVFILLLVAGWPGFSSLRAQPGGRSRLIVLTDIEADADDEESMVRLMLYSSEIDIEGLIATTSVHQKNRVYPQSIRDVIIAYGKVRANLLLHEAGYPSPAQLLSVVKSGLPSYGMNGVGEGKDSPGSDWILSVLKRNDPRPLWVSTWGGVNTLAQALYRIRQKESPEQAARLLAKLRIYTISDQDDSGAWIRSHFPSLFYIVTPGGYGRATWTGINSFIPGIDNRTISNKWLREYIQQDHGPLGAIYPDVAYGMEGDTPSWLSLIPNGLNVPERPDWGGWGGRYELYLPDSSVFDLHGFTGGVPTIPETRPIWTNATDTWYPEIPGDYGREMRRDTISFSDNKVTVWRWRDDFQNDFAARMSWTTVLYQKANHPPVPVLGNAAEFTVKSGSTFILSAKGSWDPDGDNLSYLWIPYPEAGSLKNQSVHLNVAENMQLISASAPWVSGPATVQVILRVTDKGTPALSRYKRVIVHVEPN